MGLFRTAPSASQKLRRAADQARDRKDYLEAARLYSSFLELEPGNAAIHVQAGHMFKEARHLDSARESYLQALALSPEDADLALQMGHFYKLLGQLEKSEAEYRRALDLHPNWQAAERELANLLNSGWRSSYGDRQAPSLLAIEGGNPSAADVSIVAALSADAVLAPELVPTPIEQLFHSHGSHLNMRRLGRHERTHWGLTATLRGVEAVRGFWTAELPIDEVVISLNGNIIHRAKVRGPYVLKYEIDKQRIKKYVFNEWIDFSRYENGRYLLTIDGVQAGGDTHRHEEHIVIADPLSPEEHPASDGIINVAALQGQAVEEWVNSQPSVVRPARRSFLTKPPKSILVMRTDQLGDMVASVPAVLRLRELFPEARIVGLLTTGNAEFAGTLGVFDDILIANFPDDPVQRRRVMDMAEQQKLKKLLSTYNFDLAIDLADAGVSRPLLLLSGAPVLFGFRDREFHYLTAGYEGNSHDIWNRMECAGHSTQAMSLIGRLEALMQSGQKILRRQDLSPDRLQRFGLSSERPYALLHAGARIEFSRWPGYVDLALAMLHKTEMDIVLMGLEGEARTKLPVELTQDVRFKLIEGLLPFDDFDALISFANLFVGNDSGPKHLASLRGVNVIGLHLARNNWTEWGQEHSGVVLSRRLPCAGCNIFYDAEECGKDFVCLRKIEVDEVFMAGQSLMADSARP